MYCQLKQEMSVMKNRFGQWVLPVLVFTALRAGAVERLCSVYLESPAALQQQVQLAAQVFESQELGMMPMMITMMLPGGNQVSMSDPVALHVFDIGSGRTASLVELTPATTAEMFLKSLTAAGGKPLAPAVDGRYTFDGGSAQTRGTRLLLAKTADELDACTGGAVPALPPMPAIKGVVRVAMAPSAVVPMLEAAQGELIEAMAAGGPEAAQAKDLMTLMLGLYSRTLAQINTVNLGIAVQAEGLVMRSHLVPATGSTLAGILASLQPVEPAYLGFVETDTIFSMAAGAYTLSDQLKRQVISLYIRMIEATPTVADVDTSELAFAMRESIASLGAAMAWSFAMNPDRQSFLIKGAMGITPAVPYLENMVALVNTPGMKAVMAQSGVVMSTPQKRMVKTYPAYNWKLSFDEALLRRQMGAAGQDEQAVAAVNRMMQFFGHGYDYAATPKGITFGLGSPAMVEMASDLLMAAEAQTAEAERIRSLLAPASAPVAMGRLGLLDAVRMATRIGADISGEPMPTAVAALPAGEGIVFADWLKGSEVNGAMLIPAADIKALSAMAKAMRQSEGNGPNEAGMENNKEAPADK